MSAPIKVNLPDELRHPAWTGHVNHKLAGSGLSNVSMTELQNWVIRLEFNNEGYPTHGTGFFLNIPTRTSSKKTDRDLDPTHDVILTAAHNLINDKGIRTTDMHALLPRLNIDPSAPQHKPVVSVERVPISNSDTRISADFLRKQTPQGDFGAVLVPRGTAWTLGFGYSLRLAYEASLPGTASVYGYRADTPAGSPIVSTGNFITCTGQQLEYTARTEVGISGSPVCFDFQGAPTVVAIHNHGSKRKGGGSRGSRLTPALMREVFSWVGVGRYDVLLKALSSPKVKSAKLPAAGLFLYMDEDFGFGRVKLGSGSLFDVLPVQSTSMKPGGQFAMSIKDSWAIPQASANGAVHGENWVTFNPALGEVTLTARLIPSCLFEETNVKAQRMHLVVPLLTSEDATSSAQLHALRMEGASIFEEDGDDAVSSEVSFVPYPVELDRTPFVQFWFVKP